MTDLNVVCLISGGKDSLFCILHCLQNGHKPVALANLHPPCDANHAAVEDLDSYMYQTIGHAIIPLYEKALGLPLYRQEISGSAINQNKSYAPAGESDEDETEGLIPLLNNVRAHHPEVNAVSTGAILSDYQRTRVESVARRLGLTPLSYLWQYPLLPPHSQTSLLEHMAAVGQDSHIIKVASGGLDESFLWKSVVDPLTISRLRKAAQRFGIEDDGAVLGEGGEYETLAIHGPSPLWKARIVVDEDQRENITGDAGSASVKILKASVDKKTTTDQNVPRVPIPPILEPEFESLLENLAEAWSALEGDGTIPLVKQDGTKTVRKDHAMGSELNVVDQVLLQDITGEGRTSSDQMRSIMDQIIHLLQKSEQSLANVAYTSIILRDMADFTDINAIYGSYFVDPDPPARVTFACASVIPAKKHLILSVTCVSPTIAQSRKGLHVQSRSYWAPANIGPYSQAISVPTGKNKNTSEDTNEALVYISGQIPLVPASMELSIPTTLAKLEEFPYQTALALQHAIRVARAMRVTQWICAIAFITATSSAVAHSRSKLAREAWNGIHHFSSPLGTTSTTNEDEFESFDVWDVKYGAARSLPHQQYITRDLSSSHASLFHDVPPLSVIRVDTLPRGASIEWATYGITAGCSTSLRIPHFEHLLQMFESNCY